MYIPCCIVLYESVELFLLRLIYRGTFVTINNNLELAVLYSLRWFLFNKRSEQLFLYIILKIIS